MYEALTPTLKNYRVNCHACGNATRFCTKAGGGRIGSIAESIINWKLREWSRAVKPLSESVRRSGVRPVSVGWGDG